MSEPKLPKQEVITIEPPLGGLISEFSPIANPAEGGEGQYRYSGGATAIRPGYKGHIAPCEIFNSVKVTDTSSHINSLPRAVAPHITFPGYNGNASILGGYASVAPRMIVFDESYSLDAGTYHDITASSGNNFTTLPATGYWGEDCVFYNSSLGTLGTYADAIFYSWNDSGQGNLGVFQYTGGLSWDDTYVQSNSTIVGGTWNLITGVPHRMCVGPDKILYITNGQYIASFDGTTDQTGANGTFNGQALFLGAGWIAVDVVAYQNYIAIAVCQMGSVYEQPNYSKDARVLLWDGSSLDFNQVYPLYDWAVSSLFVKDQYLYAFTQGISNTTKVKLLPMYPPVFTTVFEMPTSYMGNAPTPNQVEFFNGRVCWAPGGGSSGSSNIYALEQTANGFSVHTPYIISDGVSVPSIGFLKNLNANILFGGLQGNSFEITGVDGDGTSNSIINSIMSGTSYPELRTRLIDIGYRATITKIKAYFSSFDSTSSMYISLLPNRTAYLQDGSHKPTGDLLKWTINTTNHPLVATNFTASTAEKGSISIPDISQFWLNFRFTNTSITATPPILRKLEITIQETTKP